MINKENLEKTNAWPIVEAKKMLRERKSLIEKKWYKKSCRILKKKKRKD